MKTQILFSILLCFLGSAAGQVTVDGNTVLVQVYAKALQESSESACKCIDSMRVGNKSRPDIVKEINRCLAKSAETYQLIAKLAAADSANKAGEKGKKGRKGKKKAHTEISFDTNPNSAEYKKYYFELERYAMDSCKALRAIVPSDNAEAAHSMSANPDALALYNSGASALAAKNYEKAITDSKAALKIDSLFSFAWDNLGIAYRKTGQYENALAAYQRSIEVNPSGKVPWQNIAIVYEYQKEYQKAIGAFRHIAEFDKEDPETFYGMGRIYAFYLHDLETGLDNFCSAYVLYIAQKSPYRSDAEKAISGVYAEMKKQGKENRFNEILKAHNINQNLERGSGSSFKCHFYSGWAGQRIVKV